MSGVGLHRAAVAAAVIVGIATGGVPRARAGGAVAPAGSAPALLRPYETEAELSAYIGRRPLLCAQTSDSHRICTWTASKRQPAWSELAPTVPTEDRVNLVCELPTGDGPRKPGSCSVHPRRSNRGAWRDAQLSDEERARQADAQASGGEGGEEQKRAAARSVVDAARTALELSRMVGQGPERCELDRTTRSCLWRTTAKTQGHGTLAMAIGAPFHKKIRMECWLPAEGGPRRLETCKIEVGS